MQGGDTMAMINAIWPFILMGGIFYFMLYRPQKQEQQKRQRMLDSLKKGDKVGELLVEPGGNAIRKIDLVVKEDYEAADPGTRVLRSTQNMFSLFKSMLYF